jgi:intraflagellar transport protein 122
MRYNVVECRLVDVGRRLDKADQDGIALIAQHLCRLKQLNYATEMYRKLGDEKSIMQLYVQAREWKEAFSLIESHPEFKDAVYVQYAQWLAENDKFADAQKGKWGNK